MCELLALVGLPRAGALPWLQAFHRRGGAEGPHADGWGVAVLRPRQDADGGEADPDVAPPPEVDWYREASPASASRFAAVVRERVLGGGEDGGGASGEGRDVLLCHIRKATQGPRALRNTQPFVRELGGRLHVFAHNGDLPGVSAALAAPRCGPCRPVGDTDSEHLLCAILGALHPLWCAEEPGGVPPLEARLAAIEGVAARARALGPANFLYADGDAIFVHAHERTQPGGQVGPPGLHLRAVPASAAGEDGLLVASVPLTVDRRPEGLDRGGAGEPWRPLASGELLAIRGGRVVARTLPPGGPGGPADRPPPC